jgi:hypothetical protein
MSRYYQLVAEWQGSGAEAEAEAGGMAGAHWRLREIKNILRGLVFLRGNHFC